MIRREIRKTYATGIDAFGLRLWRVETERNPP